MNKLIEPQGQLPRIDGVQDFPAFLLRVIRHEMRQIIFGRKAVLIHRNRAHHIEPQQREINQIFLIQGRIREMRMQAAQAAQAQISGAKPA